MTKKTAWVLALLMLILFAWGLFVEAGSTRIIIDGHELTGPFKGAVGAAGFIIGLIALLCAAIFLLFAVAGFGMLILGGFVLAALMLTALASPILLLVVAPLAVVWLFIALTRRTPQ